jgi:hypothetical protein
LLLKNFSEFDALSQMQTRNQLSYQSESQV